MSAPGDPVPAPERPEAGRVVTLAQPVYTFDIDFAGVVSNIHYLRWSEIWRLEFARRLGLGIEAMLEAGLVPLMVRQELNFRRPLRFGDSVSLEGWVERIGESSVTLWLEMRNAATGEICCDNRQVMVITDPKAHAPVPIPGPFRAQLERHR